MGSRISAAVFLFFILPLNLICQGYYISKDSKYRYMVGNNNPPSDWKEKDFNDSSWVSDSGRIGYGQSDIVVDIPKTTTLYLRYKFNYHFDFEGDFHKALCLTADYNDGFVAYLNGHEIVRGNLGRKGESILCDRVADRSHKAHDYRNYYQPLNSFYIDDSVAINSLINGENVLAIEVHNDSINGSDLSFACSLDDKTNAQYNIYTDRYFKQVTLDSTRMPIVMINTDAYGISDDSSKFKANLRIISNRNSLYNKPTDTTFDYNGLISIKLHGKSSKYFFAKKSFAIETVDSIGNNNNVSLLGLPEDNDWVLVSQFTDKSFIRNDLTYYIGKRQGHYEPRTRFCELYLNDELLGLYSLTEEIKRGAERVDISKLKKTDITGNELTGGYIGEFDRLDQVIKNVYPSESEIQPEQKEYFNSLVAAYFSVLDSSYYSDPLNGYQRYINTQSLIDYAIVEEVMLNPDGYFNSTYFHKDKDSKDDKIAFGPLWDSDIAYGNFGCNIYTDWQFNIAYTALGLRKIMRDTTFVHQFQKTYFEQRKSFLNTDSINHYIDSSANYTLKDRIINFNVWPTINSALFNSCYEVDSIAEAIDYLKTWINNRLIWMDENIGNIYFPENTNTVSITENNNDILVSPNPFNDEITIDFEQPFNESLGIEIRNLLGEVVYSQHSFCENSITISELSAMPSGVYILTFQSKKLGMKTCRIVKK